MIKTPDVNRDDAGTPHLGAGLSAADMMTWFAREVLPMEPTLMHAPSPERAVIARDELRRLHAAIDDLPPRCREAIILGRVEGLTGREIAARMGISEKTASEHLAKGLYVLAETLHGEALLPGGKR